MSEGPAGVKFDRGGAGEPHVLQEACQEKTPVEDVPEEALGPGLIDGVAQQRLAPGEALAGVEVAEVHTVLLGEAVRVVLLAERQRLLQGRVGAGVVVEVQQDVAQVVEVERRLEGETRAAGQLGAAGARGGRAGEVACKEVGQRPELLELGLLDDVRRGREAIEEGEGLVPLAGDGVGLGLEQQRALDLARRDGVQVKVRHDLPAAAEVAAAEMDLRTGEAEPLEQLVREPLGRRPRQGGEGLVKARDRAEGAAHLDARLDLVEGGREGQQALQGGEDRKSVV